MIASLFQQYQDSAAWTPWIELLAGLPDNY